MGYFFIVGLSRRCFDLLYVLFGKNPVRVDYENDLSAVPHISTRLERFSLYASYIKTFRMSECHALPNKNRNQFAAALLLFGEVLIDDKSERQRCIAVNYLI